MVRKLTVKGCVCVHNPGPLLVAAAGNGVRGTAAAWATWNAIGVPGGP